MNICPCNILNSDASENVLYNNSEFPAYIKMGQLSNYPDYSAISHWHDDLEFILILKGNMTYDVNGQTINLKEGEGIFVNSRCFHYGYSKDHQECIFICILLSPKLLTNNEYFVNNYLNKLLNNNNYPYQKLNPTIKWQNIILNELDLLYKNNIDSIDPFYILEKMIRIINMLYKNMNSSLKEYENSEDIIALTKMIGYVQKNYFNKILLKDIYNIGNCCKTKCTSLFNKYLNTSPMVYLNKYRLEKASNLLNNTNNTITEIAYACGFSNASYFCELFQKYYEISPKMYRKKYKVI